MARIDLQQQQVGQDSENSCGPGGVGTRLRDRGVTWRDRTVWQESPQGRVVRVCSCIA